MLALSSGHSDGWARKQDDGGWIIQATFRALVELLAAGDLNAALAALTRRARV